MKKLALLCVLLSLVAVGCGKKTHKDHAKSKTTKSRSIKKNKNLALKESEEFFDKDGVSEFAFVDDEKNKKSEDKDSLALAEAGLPEEETTPAEEEEGSTCSFKTVHFDLNGDGVREDQKVIVEEDSSIAKEAVADGKKVVVRGHCCQLGSHAYNLALSQRRAETIKQELVNRGLPEEAIKAAGYGNEMPLVWSDSKDRNVLIKELMPNRRAEIAIS